MRAQDRAGSGASTRCAAVHQGPFDMQLERLGRVGCKYLCTSGSTRSLKLQGYRTDCQRVSLATPY